MDASDLSTRPEVLLAHAEWVRALARRLLRDEALADDVVQEAWLAALRRPPGGVRDPGAWLATVVRNLAHRAMRTRTRAALRERHAASPAPAPTPAEVLEQESMRRRVVEAVLALDEPYRATLLLRYYEDLSPAAIAQRLGVPGGTVRTRLKRALALLRDRLATEATDGDGATSWHAGLAVLARWAVPSSPTLPPTAAATTGGMLMSAKPVLAVSVGLVALVATVFVVLELRGGGGPVEGEDARLAVAPNPGDDSVANAGAPLATLLSAEVDRRGDPTAAARKPVGFALEVQYADGRPAADAQVVLFHDEVLAKGYTNDDGAIEFPVTVDECEVAVWTWEAPLLWQLIRTDVSPLTVHLAPSAEVAGWITVDGEPPGEEVELLLHPREGWEDADRVPDPVWWALDVGNDNPRTATAGEDGSFRFVVGLAPDWKGGYIRVHRPEGLRPWARDADGSLSDPAYAGPDPRVDGPVEGMAIDFLTMVRMRGRVVHADGAPLEARAWVYPELRRRDGSPGWSGQGQTEVDGRFEWELDPGDALESLTLAVSISRAGHRAYPLPEPTPDAEGIWELGDFLLGRLRELHFLVLDGADRPIPGAYFLVWNERWQVLDEAEDPTDAAGQSSLTVDFALDRVLVQAPGFRTQEVPVAEPAPDPIVVRMVHGTALLITLHPAGDPWPAGIGIDIGCGEALFPASGGWAPGEGNALFRGTNQTMTSERGEWPFLRSYPDDEGRLGYSDVRANAPLYVRVVDKYGFAACTRTVPPLREGEVRALDIEVPDVGRTLRGVVLDAAGEPVAGANVTYGRPELGQWGQAKTMEDGSFELRGFLPDRGALQVQQRAFAPLLLPNFALPAGDERIPLQLSGGRRVRVHVVDDEGTGVEDAEIAVRVEGFLLDSRMFSVRAVTPGLYDVEDLPPGEVEFVVRHGERSTTLRHDTALPEVRCTLSDREPR